MICADIGNFEQLNPTADNGIAKDLSKGALGISADPDIAFNAPIGKSGGVLEFIRFQLNFLERNGICTIHSVICVKGESLVYIGRSRGCPLRRRLIKSMTAEFHSRLGINTRGFASKNRFEAVKYHFIFHQYLFERL